MSKLLRKLNRYHTKAGFTIVELLVVIVVIGILAAITMVSYSGITQKAKAAVLQSDLKNASTILELDKTINGTYPSSEAAANGGKGLPKSNGTTYQYIPSTSGDSYYILATSSDGSVSYSVSSKNNGYVSEAVKWKQISSGAASVCALTFAGDAYCWGWNQYGQIGNGTTTNSTTPVAVDMTPLNSKKFVAISAGFLSSCGIDTDGKVFCWGLNSVTGPKLTPVAVDMSGLGSLTAKSISVGHSGTACIIASNDLPYCWGGNSYGELGNGSNTTSALPVAVEANGALSGKTVKQISAGGYVTCVIASDNHVYCWGNNSYGQLGNGLTTNSNLPVAVSTSGALSGKNLVKVAINSNGGHDVCAVDTAGKLYCWGYNDGETNALGGSDNSANSAVPVEAVSAPATKDISIGSFYYLCLITTADVPYCRGPSNGSGELGNNSNDSYATNTTYGPVYASGALSGKTVKSIASGITHTCVLASDNQIYCWGWYSNGVEGHDDMRLSPTLVPLSI